MILTRIDRLVLEDMPERLKYSLKFLIINQDAFNNPRKAIDFIENNNFSYKIEKYLQKDSVLSFWRSHREYIYLYMIISGEEIIDINDISALQLTQNHNTHTDQILYSGLSQSRIRLKENNIIILYPEDAYRIHYIPSVPVKKCCIKISLIGDF